jgi:hypothetical protein
VCREPELVDSAHGTVNPVYRFLFRKIIPILLINP